MFNKNTIENIFSGAIIGKEIIFLESVDSTNRIAVETALNREDPEGIVVVADTQTKGKGRLGRRWISPPGVNLYFTLLLKPPFPPADAPILTLAAAVAAAKAIRKLTGLKAEIKWPNDILINSKKSAGILLEMRCSRDRIRFLAIGMGINVNMLPDDLPEDIRPLTTSLNTELGRMVSRTDLLRGVLEEMENTYKNLLLGNKRGLINEWLGLNSTIGKDITVRQHDRTVSGTAEGISDTGGLILRLSTGETETFSAGEVTILKI